jgi:DNA-binding NtrC family response regulator
LAPDTSPPRLGIVDDDEDFLTSIGIESDNILTTNDPEVSLEWVRRRLIDVLIADLRMPGESGVELLQRARAIDPDLTLALWTGNKPEPHEADILDALQAEPMSKTKHRLHDILEFAAGLVDLVPKHKLVHAEKRLAQLERLNQAWVADMIDQLRQIPDAEHAIISASGQSFTVAQLIDDIQHFRTRGVEYINLWRQAQARVRKERR